MRDIYPGKYIVIEGTDGTGKSTQLDIVADTIAARGHQAITVSEPADPDDEREGLPIARELRRLVKNGDIDRLPETNLLIFTAARAEKWHNEIEPALKIGKHVLSSRNYWSTEAYQGYGEGLDLELIQKMTDLTLGKTGYTNPDAAIILAMNDERARLERVSMRGAHEHRDAFETKGADFQSKVAQGYLKVAMKYAVPVVEADGTKDDVSVRVLAELDRQLPDLLLSKN